MSIEPVNPFFSANLRHKLTRIHHDVGLYESKENPYTTEDLKRITNIVNQLSLNLNIISRSSLEDIVYRITNLQLEDPSSIDQRLVTIKASIQDLQKSVTKEIRQSAFFRPGKERKEHVKKVMRNLKKDIHDPSYENMMANRAFKKLELEVSEFFVKTSIPHASKIIRKKQHEAYSKTPGLPDYLKDKPLIGITPSSSKKDSKQLSQEQMQRLVNKAHNCLFDILSKEKLEVADDYWINREGGIFACRSATFQDRLMSVAGGCIALEYLKQHAKLIEEFKDLFEETVRKTEKIEPQKLMINQPKENVKSKGSVTYATPTQGTLAGAFAIVNSITEDLLKDRSPAVKKTVTLAGVALMGSPIFVTMGIFTGAAVFGAGFGICTGAMGSLKENEELRENAREYVFAKPIPFSYSRLPHPDFKDCHGRVTGYVWR